MDLCRRVGLLAAYGRPSHQEDVIGVAEEDLKRLECTNVRQKGV